MKKPPVDSKAAAVRRPAMRARTAPAPVQPEPAQPKRHKRVPRIAESDNWDQRLGFLMHDVSRLRRNVFDEFMKPLGVTRSQWWVLAYLSRHDGMIQSELASVLELGKAALGGLVDRLEASLLVERRSDEVDRRAKRVFLSPRGLRLITEMRMKSHEMSERMLVGLDLASRLALAEHLSTIKRNLVAIRQEESGKS